MKKKKIAIIILLFFILLTSTRILWLHLFTQPDQPYAEKGQIDVRDFDFQQNALTLDGEWTFYSSHWLMDSNQPPFPPRTYRFQMVGTKFFKKVS